MRLKSLPIFIFIVYAVLNFNTSQAQCSSGSPQSITETQTGAPDRLLNTYNFAKFNPSLGTLQAVDIHVTTSGVTMLQIINGDMFDNEFKKIRFRRVDEIDGPGFGTYTINDTTINFPDTTIGASQTPPPDDPPFPVNGDHSNEWWGKAKAPNNKVFDATIDPSFFSFYIGSGSIGLDYSIYPAFSAASYGSHVSLNYVTLATNLNISITYTYCPNSILPIGRVDFFAKAGDNNNVELNWTKANEENNIEYGIEMSTNGLDFSKIGTIQSQKPANSSTVVRYEYNYHIPSATNGKIFFRIKQTDALGRVQYSAIRSISTINKEISLTLYPNPASDKVILQFGSALKNRVQVDLINSIGQVVETAAISPSGAGSEILNFKNKHTPGVYFIRALDVVTKKQQVGRLIIK